MEIEFKYTVDEERCVLDVLRNPLIEQLKILGTENTIDMQAIYYKHIKQQQMGFKFAYRVRKENDAFIATIKYNSRNSNGLHIREEYDVEVSDMKPNLAVFINQPCWKLLSEYISLEEAENVEMFSKEVETKFIRRCFRINCGDSTAEVAFDVGEILANDKKSLINEIEIELLEGDIKEVNNYIKPIVDKLDLIPLNISKYKRGLDLY